jgi:hypothetical protein
VRDANSVFWNPAGVTGIQSTEASFSYSNWFADMNYLAGAVGAHWHGIGAISVGVTSLDYGSIPEALVENPSGSSDTRTGSTFTGGDMLVGLALSREFTDKLSIGVGVKYIQEKLFVYNVHVFAYDIGTNYDVGYKGIRLAMAAQNFGPSVKWLEESNRPEGYDLPLTFRIGTSFNLFDAENGFLSLGEGHRMMIAADAIHTNDYGDRLHLGAEYTFGNFLALRGGYRFNYEEGNLSLGVGLSQALGTMNVRLDYAYVGYTHLNTPHRLTLSVAY